eukprot:1469394-Amphidinium_carterae.1
MISFFEIVTDCHVRLPSPAADAFSCDRGVFTQGGVQDVSNRRSEEVDVGLGDVEVGHIACPGVPSSVCLHHLARRRAGSSRGGYAVGGAAVVAVDGWCGAEWVLVVAAAGQFCLAAVEWGLQKVDEGLGVSVGVVFAGGLSRRGNRRGMKSTSAWCSMLRARQLRSTLTSAAHVVWYLMVSSVTSCVVSHTGAISDLFFQVRHSSGIA